jgi:glycosyltransferase involved in cell wall biosynthesis
MHVTKLKKLLVQNDFFDKVFYLRSYHDARLADATPIDHYVNIGINENRKPNATFDPVWYLKNYTDVRKSGIPAVIHYLKHGYFEGRLQNAHEKEKYVTLLEGGEFDLQFYRSNYQDLQSLNSSFDLITHYIRHGQYEGRIFKKTDTEIKRVLGNTDPNKKNNNQNKHVNFKNYHSIENKYLRPRLRQLSSVYKRCKKNNTKESFEELLSSVKNVIDIYEKFSKLNKRFLSTFDEREYLDTHVDVNNAVKNEKISSGLEHLIIHGWEEVNTGQRRLYSKTDKFNEKEYLKSFPDVSRALQKEIFASALEHFINYGEQKKIEDNKKEKNNNICIQLNQIDPLKHTVMICAHVVGDSLFGSERSLIDMVVAASQKHNVILLAPRMNESYLTAVKPYVNKILTVSYGWWKIDTKIDQERVDEIAKIIKNNNVCLVHVNTIMLREPILAAKQVGVNSLTHIRELISGDPALIKHIGLELDEIINEVVDRSDYIIGNSNATLEAYNLLNNNQSYLLYNTVDCSQFESKPVGDVVNVGIISSNIPKKGILDFTDIAQSCIEQDNLRFKLIGPENEHTREIVDRGLSNLEVLGYKASPQEAMQEVDVVLSLSHFKESFGRTVAEAMASSKPVIAYRWGAVPELIEHGITGYLVDYKDKDAVVTHLKKIAQTPSSISVLGREGRKRALKKFDFSSYKKQLNSIYQGTIEKEKANKIKIAYFMWHFPVPSETFVLNELRSLVQQNYDVKVYCKQSPYKDFTPDFPIEWQRIDDVDDFAEKLKQDKREIVHSHFVYPTVTDMVWPASLKSGVPFTFIAHAQDIFRYTNIEKNRIDEVAKSQNCLKVFVPSNFHFNYLEEQGVPAEKMLITPNTVDPDLYSDGLNVKHEERSYKSICAIHRFTEKKGLESLIKSAKYLDNNIKINIYGYGDLESEYKTIIRDNSLSNVKIHAGVKSRQEMLEVYAQHDLFACPSIRAKDGDMDGIPTVLMESMASGLPVLTTQVAGIPDLVVDELTGIVTESEPQKIAQDIHRFYALPTSKVEAIRENARSLIEANFNTFYATDNLLRVWENQTIDLIIVSWNNLLELREVCRRLIKYTSLPYRLIICDNQSESDVIEYLTQLNNQFEQVTVIFNQSNDMVGPGTNLALEEGSSDYAIYVCGKEGFTFKHGWEIPLVKYMNQNPKVGQAGTLGYSPSYLYGKDYPGGISLFDKFRNQEFASLNPEQVFKHVQGGFFIMRRKMYEEIGGFSYEVPHSYTDVEYSFYVESCGWELGQIPEMMALFNKTRPGLFSRIDEKTTAIHPPMMNELDDIEKIIKKTVDLCHVCESRSSKFKVNNLGQHICDNCGSTEVDRTLFKYLAESVFTHRRVPALGINVGRSMHDFWQKQFQGRLLDSNTFTDEIKNQNRIDHSDNSIHLIYIRSLRSVFGKNSDLVIKELIRILNEHGELVLHLDEDFNFNNLKKYLHQLNGRLKIVNIERFTSEVCHFDWNQIAVFKKENNEKA